MRILALFGLFVLLGSGCETVEERQATEEYEKRLSPSWLHENMMVNSTTKAQVLTWFGQPMNRSTMASSSDLMPDEIWTYAVKFSKAVRGWDPHMVSWVRSLTVSFKGDKVASYNTFTTGDAPDNVLAK